MSSFKINSVTQLFNYITSFTHLKETMITQIEYRLQQSSTFNYRIF